MVYLRVLFKKATEKVRDISITRKITIYIFRESMAPCLPAATQQRNFVEEHENCQGIGASTSETEHASGDDKLREFAQFFRERILLNHDKQQDPSYYQSNHHQNANGSDIPEDEQAAFRTRQAARMCPSFAKPRTNLYAFELQHLGPFFHV